MSSAYNQFDFKPSSTASDIAEIDLQDQESYFLTRLGLLVFCEERATAHLRSRSFGHLNGSALSRQITLLKFKSRARALFVPFE